MFRQKVPAVTAAGASVAVDAVNGEAVQVLSPLALRSTAALLALGVAVVHVADQGGIASFNSPDWLGWSFRLIEVGGVLTAIILLLPRSGRLGWAAGVLVGLGPFLGYLATRSIGLPGDPGDVGDWGYWVGTVSLIIEAALIVLSVAVLLAQRRAAGLRSGLVQAG
jgi:hypothetical protein